MCQEIVREPSPTFAGKSLDRIPLGDSCPSSCSHAAPPLSDPSMPPFLQSLFPISHFFYRGTPQGLVAQSCHYSRHGEIHTSSLGTGKWALFLILQSRGPHTHYYSLPRCLVFPQAAKNGSRGKRKQRIGEVHTSP